MVGESEQIVDGLRRGDRSVFKRLFDHYYTLLVLFAHKFVTDLDTARELVQDFFVYLWEFKEKLVIKVSIKSYMYTSVKNRCFNFLKLKRKSVSLENIDHDPGDGNHFFENMVYSEYENAFLQEIKNLPPRCQEVFRLKRFQHKTNQEIAEILSVSIKTVEAQMSIALRRLRDLSERIT
ncbi:RNA polymerase sigma-70 factor [Echinicola salinicaeni]|uniref:RNA polymerase sigma-70 factor n=1 Tax=Echinicola salinicaeni TaxID=2762757 RepID=UPI0016485F59|nr:RNA polymerase sigma-70 factor [Echinicola salinicaeni]